MKNGHHSSHTCGMIWECFFPNLTASYKAQFRSRRHRQTEAIYAFVDVLQCIYDMAWWFMDSLAKEKFVVDQFLMGMDSHELNVQAVAHGHHLVEDVLWVACSRETMHEEHKQYSHGHQPTTQACFLSNECTQSPSIGRLIKELLVQLGHDSCDRRDTYHLPPTPGPIGLGVPSRKWSNLHLVPYPEAFYFYCGTIPKLQESSVVQELWALCWQLPCEGFYQLHGVREPSWDVLRIQTDQGYGILNPAFKLGKYHSTNPEGDPKRSAKKTAPVRQSSKEPVSLGKHQPRRLYFLSQAWAHQIRKLALSPGLVTQLVHEDKIPDHPCLTRTYWVTWVTRQQPSWLLAYTHAGGRHKIFDTGASVTMMGQPLYQKIQQSSPLCLQMRDTATQRSRGNPMATFGHTEWRCTGPYMATVVVTVWKERPNLSSSWFRGCSWLWPIFTWEALHNQGTSGKVHPWGTRSSWAKLILPRYIEVLSAVRREVACNTSKCYMQLSMNW